MQHKSKGIGTKTLLSTSYELNRSIENYGIQINKLATEANLPPSYFIALITLECSGKADVKPRFESHVYKSLKQVRDKTLANYGSITHKTIHDASDEALRNLATSWGPFQLMGYQCIELGVNVADIRGDNSLYWGVYWINKRYGKALREKRFKDAFHIHNTGRPYPTSGKPMTYDPKYVDRGIHYMESISEEVNEL